jgi:hypothetical protein
MGLHGALGVAPLPGTPPVGMSATDMRLSLGGIFGITPQLVTGGGVAQSGSNMNCTVAQSVFQLADVTNAAATTFLPTDSTVVTPAVGPGTGTRVDLIVIPFKNWENGDGTSQSQPVLVAGTPGTPGVAPPVPAGSHKYAQITVPAGASTASACTVVIFDNSTYAPPDLQTPTLALLNGITGLTSQQATVYNDTTNNGLYQWFGSAWVKVGGGALTKVKPTSAVATGGSAAIASGGRTTFSAVNAVNLVGLFSTSSPAYDYYEVEFYVSATSGSPFITAVLGNGGTPVTTANYDSNYNFRSTTTNSPANSSAAASLVLSAGGAAGIKRIRMRIENPNIAAPTTGKVSGTEYTVAAVPYSYDGEIGHRLSTAYADLQFLASTGTMTGWVDVFGYSNS